MKAGELARLLGVSRQTVSAWAKLPEIAPYLSPDARGESSLQAVFLESDIDIMATIYNLRAKDIPFSEIGIRLSNGERISNLPMSAVPMDTRTIPLPQAKQAAEKATIEFERNSLMTRVKDLEQQLKEAHEKNETLLREISELRYQIGYLEALRDINTKD